MPKLETIISLGKDFNRIAVANRGVATVMSQYSLKELIDYDVYQGSCHGLSVMWLAYKHAPAMKTDLFEELLGSESSDAQRQKLLAFTNKAHEMQSAKHDKDESVGQQKKIKQMSFFGLNFVEAKLFGGGWGKGHTDLGKYISKNRGYYLVSIKGHAMAACSAVGSLAFYDPNIGEATFVDGSSMGSFFSQYFKSPIMAVTYDVAGKVQVTASRYV